MLVFLEEQQQYIMTELADANMEVLGKCITCVNVEKAKFLMKHRRNRRKLTNDKEHALLVEIASEYKDNY